MFFSAGRVDFEAASGIGDRTFVGPESDLASVPANEIYFRDRNHPDNPVSIYTLDPGAPHPLIRRLGQLEMLLFGSEGEYFLTHRITLHGEPRDNAFHQVFPVSTASAEHFRSGSLEQAVVLMIDGSEATDLGRLPVAGGTFPARIEGLIEGASRSLTVDVEVGAEHYLEILG